MLSPASRVTDWRKRSWQPCLRQQEAMLLHVCLCVCVCVRVREDQLWQNMWKDEKRMTAIIPAHTAHWSPPNAILPQSSCSAVAPLWMPNQDTRRILTSLILSEISDLFSAWNIRTQLRRHIHFSDAFSVRYHGVVFIQSIESCLCIELFKEVSIVDKCSVSEIN